MQKKTCSYQSPWGNLCFTHAHKSCHRIRHAEEVSCLTLHADFESLIPSPTPHRLSYCHPTIRKHHTYLIQRSDLLEHLHLNPFRLRLLCLAAETCRRWFHWVLSSLCFSAYLLAFISIHACGCSNCLPCRLRTPSTHHYRTYKVLYVHVYSAYVSIRTDNRDSSNLQHAAFLLSCAPWMFAGTQTLTDSNQSHTHRHKYI